MFVLIDDDGKRRELSGSGPWLVGRHSSADIRFDDPYCPRRAFQLERSDTDLLLTPLSEQTPILIEGRRCTDEYRIAESATLQFGRSTVRVARAKQDEPEADKTRAVIGPLHGNSDATRSRGQAALRTVRPGTVIGREGGAGVHEIDDPTVSRRHAELRHARQGVEIADLGSTNGTFVNGRRIHGGHPLEDGDQVVIGHVRFRFHDGQMEEPRTSAGQTIVAARGLAVDVPTKEGIKRILHPCSLKVRQGEFVCLVGGSGAGKTTMMNTLAGRAPLAEGEIEIDGSDLVREFESLKLFMAYVPQREVLHGLLSLRRALGFIAELRLPSDTSAAERSEAVLRAVRRVELEGQLDTPFHKLSGGQKKRACLAAEILCVPRVLFLDEVTSGLDEQTEFEIMRLLARLAKEGTTIICVTHALANIPTFCDRVVVMAPGGYLTFTGTPDEALAFFRVERLGDAIGLLSPEAARDWAARFRGESGDRDYVVSEISTPRLPFEKPGLLSKVAKAIDQVGILVRRNLLLLVADRPTLVLALVQAITIGVFVGWAFSDFGSGFEEPQSQQILLTLMVMSGIWTGASGASKDIVCERDIVQRERDVSLSLVAYLISRLWVGSLFVIAQLTIVFALILALADSIPGETSSQYLLLLLTGFVGVAIGLLISAAAASDSQATTIVPLVLVPQLVLIGSIVPNLPEVLDDFSSLAIPTNVLREAMFAIFVRGEGTIEIFDAATGRPAPLTADPLKTSFQIIFVQYAIIVTATVIVLMRRYRSGVSR
ncbi:MAG TPA: FHA domain-containing protein [Croceibacterium sp.]